MLERLKADGVTLVLVTHNVAEGLALGTHAAIMRSGSIVRHDRRASIDPVRYVGGFRELGADDA